MPASSTACGTLAAALLLVSASASAHLRQEDAAASLPVASAALAPYVTFEAGPVQALLLTPDGRLLALNTQDDRIEVYGVELPAATGRTPQPGSGSVGKKPAPGGPFVPPATGSPAGATPLPALSWRGSVFTGLSPVAMTLDPADANRLFVSNHVSDSVSVVDLAKRQVVATIDVGDEPQGLVVTGGGSSWPARVPHGRAGAGAGGSGRAGEQRRGRARLPPWERLAPLPLGAVRRRAPRAGGQRARHPQDAATTPRRWTRPPPPTSALQLVVRRLRPPRR
jgi:YVTN family beta-propeller protein